MNGLRAFLILLLTAVVLATICAPMLLQDVIPSEYMQIASLDQFPLLGTFGRVARSLANAIEQRERITVDLVANALGDSLWDEAVALVMVAVLTIPVSLILGLLLYKPLYKGLLTKAILYTSLNLCSVMIAWVLYRQLYFRLLIEGLIQQYITDDLLQKIASYVTQIGSALLVGAVTFKIVLAAVAAKVVLGKLVMPLIGTVLRTLLFAFLLATILLLRDNPDEWRVFGMMMLVTLCLSGLSDALFGS